ncbi:hypothetical protein [Undibacterium sp. Xuan67W]|uniref:hypothetical protein n=1 Tax=Undibacterium sp. Xuan67W TaxID=3413057 RepID=UPI003BF4383B
MSFVEEVVKLFGASIASTEIATFLSSQAEYRVSKLSDGDQYVVSKEGGFDLLFCDAPSAPRRHPQYRTLEAVFLFSSGAENHKEFSGELPFVFSFRDSRDDLIAKRQPDRTWVIGRGRVPITHPNPSSDSWNAEFFNISITYWDDGRVHSLQLGPPAEFSSEMASPTWQELALMSDQKLVAIKLYQKEHGTNVVDAKKAIDEYINGEVS